MPYSSAEGDKETQERRDREKALVSIKSERKQQSQNAIKRKLGNNHYAMPKTKNPGEKCGKEAWAKAAFLLAAGPLERFGADPLKLQQLKFQQRKGFSLVELLTVVAILGVLSAVAVPTYTRYRKQAGLKALAADAKNIKKAILACSAMFPFSSCDSAAEIESKLLT